LLKESPKKTFSCCSLNELLKKTDSAASIEWKTGSGHVHTGQNDDTIAQVANYR